MSYCFDIVLVPDKELYTANTLSRATLATLKTSDSGLTCLAEAYVNAVLLTSSASDRRLEETRSALKKDDTLRVVMHHVQNGWPDKKTMKSPVKSNFNEQYNPSVHDRLLLRGKRLVIPLSLRQDILRYLHDGRQGVNKTKDNAATQCGSRDFHTTSTRW